MSVEMNGRALPPSIPEDGEAPDHIRHGEMNGYQRLQAGDGGEAELPVSKSQRRKSDVKVYKEFCDFYARFNMANALANAMCERCKSRFAPAEKIVNSNGELYHEQCFVCAQCFQQFPEGLFYEFEGRKYCEHDFQMLFAPCCHQCGEFIIGRVIKAMNNSWHPECFCCDLCQAVLADVGFVKNAGRHLCRPCHNKEKARGLGKYVCQKCHAIIDEQPLLFKNDPYHPDHFNCNNCGKELTADARELKGELYCLPCHDKMGVPICGACRRPIEGRVVNAMGKQWHVEHFVCAKCEKPFLGHRHYERKGLAYCETHYNQVTNTLQPGNKHTINDQVTNTLQTGNRHINQITNTL
ncbi:LIM and senescent cell antigen-like-containing domain protein 1 isoform X5 [Poecilia formosa]|uniref:LIM and senescent cell antigen-like-containing domain protein 1 isoform X5 n=1 Tax=Poecilia formosa TaxID=48698 RepID=UPI0007B8E388|nr:PREDICTED: LIM and senescent cell antigen-like-containing domain protein 1 isoform X5 [Poecilia formosa]